MRPIDLEGLATLLEEGLPEKQRVSLEADFEIIQEEGDPYEDVLFAYEGPAEIDRQLDNGVNGYDLRLITEDNTVVNFTVGEVRFREERNGVSLADSYDKNLVVALEDPEDYNLKLDNVEDIYY